MVGPEERAVAESLGGLGDAEQLLVGRALLGFGEDSQLHDRPLCTIGPSLRSAHSVVHQPVDGPVETVDEQVDNLWAACGAGHIAGLGSASCLWKTVPATFPSLWNSGLGTDAPARLPGGVWS
ncbi:hypothetical protein GCM10023094_38210 [Rhodococcus olei]|uniref:Uncharacterized protein n=1 Tax=Rhodococcus olei TaxID=2161675 RepID=A0ABP8PAT0_9NOCA